MSLVEFLFTKQETYNSSFSDSCVAISSIDAYTYPKCLPVFQLKSSGSKVHLISMVRQDAETVFQQIKELGMTGKGWVWIGTDGATSSTFNHQKDLGRTMEGIIGTQPKNGEGSIYLKFLAAWLKKDSTTYPGIVHSKPVSHLLSSCLL